MFGQTETTGIVMTYPIPSEETRDDRPYRQADRQHASLCVGRLAPPGSGRHLRRIVYRRRRHRSRLHQSARADGKEFRIKSVRPAGRQAALPNRRPGALSLRRQLSRSSAAPTSRSRSGASASSQARSRPQFELIRACDECVVTAADDWKEQDRDRPSQEPRGFRCGRGQHLGRVGIFCRYLARSF